MNSSNLFGKSSSAPTDGLQTDPATGAQVSGAGKIKAAPRKPARNKAKPASSGITNDVESLDAQPTVTIRTKPLRVLAMCFFPAFAPPKSGGEMRVLNLYKHLSKYVHVDLLTSSGIDAPLEVVNHAPRFVEHRVPKGERFAQIYAEFLKGSPGNDVSGAAVAASVQCDDAYMLKYLELYRTADVIIHDFPFTLTADIFFGLDKKPRVYASHNGEYRLSEDLFPGSEGAGLRAWITTLEKQLLEGADLVTYCSLGDKVLFEELLGRELTNGLLAPNGLSRHVSKPSSYQSSARPRAVYFGSAHAPSAEAAKFIVEILAPSLPDIHFDIGGTCWNAKLATPPNVTAHGLVSNTDKIKLLEAASVALNPMSSGGGSNLKALEYMAFGLPILSTEFGMRGIEAVVGTHFVGAHLADFSSALSGMIVDIEATRAIGLRAQREVAQLYDWAVIAERFAQSLLKLQPKQSSMIGHHILTLNDYDYSSVVGGGATRICGLYSGFAAHMPVIGLCFSDDGYFGRTWINNQFVVLKVPKTGDHVEHENHNASRFHISARDIIAMEHAGRNRLLSAIYVALSQEAARIVIEHPYMVALPKANKDRFIYSSQNHETLLKQELLVYHPDADVLLPAIVKGEAYAISHADMVIGCSQEDLRTMNIGVSQAPPMAVVRNGVERPAQPSGVKPALSVEKNAIVFLGSAHMPNIESARFILDKMVSNFPKHTFHFVGSICDALNEEMPRNVVLHGKVSNEEKSAILRASQIALNPMFSGGGSNVKMADYLAHGLATLTTPFGIRGYPDAINDLIVCTEGEAFCDALGDMLRAEHSPEDREKRVAVFEQCLSFEGLSHQYREHLTRVGQERKRALFVTYRYTDPVLGGAEAHMISFLKSLDDTHAWWIDVVSPQVSQIGSSDRFAGTFSFDPSLSAPSSFRNVRWRRFDLDSAPSMATRAELAKLWQTEIEFEKQLTQLLSEGDDFGCRWGWYSAESWGGQLVRRASVDCGIACLAKSELTIEGLCERDLLMSVTDQSGVILAELELTSGPFACKIPTGQGLVRFTTTLAPANLQDARPLGWVLTGMSLAEEKLDIREGLPQILETVSSVDRIRIMDMAAKATRWDENSKLTSVRGPFSREMETWLHSNMSDYDLLITHNPIFRPVIVALEAAKSVGVPSVLIPHCHLDDDYYHFPDVVGAADLATATASCPDAVVKFFEAQGYSGQSYLPAPTIIDDVASDEDIAEFKALVTDDVPFILVLGRKAGAKGYQHTIDAVEKIAATKKVRVILIGPDDDKVAVKSPHAIYLGLQPRSVVRGALACCKAMCTMSQSESFGLVIVEAWAAGAPVVANGDCLAFADLIDDGVTGLLVTPKTLQLQLERVLFEPHLAAKLTKQTKEIAKKYSTAVVGEDFGNLCLKVMQSNSRNAA